MDKNLNSNYNDPLKDIDPVMEKAFSPTENDTPYTPPPPPPPPINDPPSDLISEATASDSDDTPLLDSRDSFQESSNISQIEFPDLNLDQSNSYPKIEDDIFNNIPVKVSVELGRSQLTLKEVYELTEGAIIELERLVGEPLDLVVNGQVVAQGEVVAIDNKYGLRVKTLLSTLPIR